MSLRDRAFTLIELLIVVAIIAILAAIAVPNFLEAQTRAKVSRMKSDMRSLATAFEAYRIDNNKYPYGAEDTDWRTPITANPFEGITPVVITTPIAYITSLVSDTFTPKRGLHPSSQTPLHYGERVQATALDPTFFTDLTTDLAGRPIDAAAWYTFSHGPDQDHDEDLTLSDPTLATQLYDPTNGTISSGDIYDFGPGLGFLR
jgi:type II secretion system protein G